jgi:hypothetical protein
MLSDQERRELKAVAASATIQGEFRLLRNTSHGGAGRPVDLDRFLDFLTAMNRFSMAPRQPRPVHLYNQVRL